MSRRRIEPVDFNLRKERDSSAISLYSQHAEQEGHNRKQRTGAGHFAFALVQNAAFGKEESDVF